MAEENEKVEIDYEGKRLVPVFGEMALEVDYTMTHTKYGQINKYKVVCRLSGLQWCNPSLDPKTAERIGDPEQTNDETLTEEAALELFADKNS